MLQLEQSVDVQFMSGIMISIADYYSDLIKEISSLLIVVFMLLLQ